MMRRVPAVEKLEQYIGFKPSNSLERIIADVVDDQRRLAAGKGEADAAILHTPHVR
jgi:hypothetical protein